LGGNDITRAGGAVGRVTKPTLRRFGERTGRGTRLPMQSELTRNGSLTTEHEYKFGRN
jgi:hypothetical protein